MFSPVFLGSVVGFILVVNESVLRFSLLSSCVFVSRFNLGRGFPLGFLCVFDVFLLVFLGSVMYFTLVFLGAGVVVLFVVVVCVLFSV